MIESLQPSQQLLSPFSLAYFLLWISFLCLIFIYEFSKIIRSLALKNRKAYVRLVDLENGEDEVDEAPMQKGCGIALIVMFAWFVILVCQFGGIWSRSVERQSFY